jgi:hypothetical protein
MEISADTLHRLKKALLDSGEAVDLEDANRLFARYWVILRFDGDTLRDSGKQVALLTAINTASRAFDGQVRLEGPMDIPFNVPGFCGTTVGTLATRWQIKQADDVPADAPVISFRQDDTASVRPFANGWRAAVVGRGCAMPFDWGHTNACAAVAAGALAVGEAFALQRGENPEAGYRVEGLSLWRPELRHGWDAECADGPALERLPKSLWLVGLGHLGQAYAWTVSFLPFPAAELFEFWLQDVDTVGVSTLSSSVLSDRRDVGRMKTRIVSEKLESIGFKTRILERLFSNPLGLQADEPRVALIGVDNAAARRPLSTMPFDFIAEAGLGSGYDDFQCIRIHTFPSQVDSSHIWATDSEAHQAAVQAPAYEKMLRAGASRCGVTMLASRAVGAPFVGCFAASLAVAEVLRLLHGGERYAAIDLSLRGLRAGTAATATNPAAVNPGFIPIPSRKALDSESFSIALL